MADQNPQPSKAASANPRATKPAVAKTRAAKAGWFQRLIDGFRVQAEVDDSLMTDSEQGSLAYRYSLRLGLPVAISLAIHLLLLLFLALTTWEVLIRTSPKPAEYHASLTDSFDGPSVDSFQWSKNSLAAPSPTNATPVNDATLDLGSLSELDLSFGNNPSDTGSGFDSGLGFGDDFGLGSDRDSILGTGVAGGATGNPGSDTGLSGGGSGRMIGSAGMWGRTVRANRVVFVIDFSGSIIIAIDDLKRELKRSIGSLRSDQSFNVVIFYSVDGRFKTEAFAPALKPATRQMRQRFFSWIDAKSPAGGTDPLPAMQRALRMEPDAVFFLSDGEFEDQVANKITAANRGQTQICCLVFDDVLLDDLGPATNKLTENARRLERIAKASGGWMAIVTAGDLRRSW